jgi:hypothetical protein
MLVESRSPLLNVRHPGNEVRMRLKRRFHDGPFSTERRRRQQPLDVGLPDSPDAGSDVSVVPQGVKFEYQIEGFMHQSALFVGQCARRQRLSAQIRLGEKTSAERVNPVAVVQKDWAPSCRLCARSATTIAIKLVTTLPSVTNRRINSRTTAASAAPYERSSKIVSRWKSLQVGLFQNVDTIGIPHLGDCLSVPRKHTATQR